MRKVRNLTGKKLKKVQLSLSGMVDEMIYEGGEKQFIQNMIIESVNYAENCLWFSSLVSNERNLNRFYSSLEKYGAKDVKTIHMTTANKISRIVAWTFQSEEKQKQWKKK
jgi:23S rRNA (adenine1618-N6)-methyltransferase